MKLNRDCKRVHHLLSVGILSLLLVACGGGSGGGGDITPPTLSITDASVTEGSSGGTTNLEFTVVLNAASSSDVTVEYTTSDGTALAGSDYTADSGSLIIAAGSTTGAIIVVVSADTIIEADETLMLTLSNAGNATISTASATGTIVNDDVGLGVLNDTGINTWGDDTVNDLTATQANFPGQDADYGRDATEATNSNSDGKAGFSFTKLDSTGAALADQAAVYVTTPWDCVQDQVTGLMWEVKSAAASGTLRDASYTYTWYNSDAATNGGSAGTENSGACFDGANCDTEKYVAAVNAAGLCGHTDWRLPKKEALRSIVDYSISAFGLTIDRTYFPNTEGSGYWSSSPVAGTASNALDVYFYSGNGSAGGKSNDNYVRLVRGGQ